MGHLPLLFWEFFKIGLFAVGGGLVTIGFVKDMALRYPLWFSMPDVGNMLAVAQSAPGAIGVNLATYAGFTVSGVPGAFVAVFALVLPTLIIVVLVSKVLHQFRQNRYVIAAFYGLRPASLALVAAAIFPIFADALFPHGLKWVSFQLSQLSVASLLIFAGMMLISHIIKRKINPVFYILAGAILGMVLSL